MDLSKVDHEIYLVERPFFNRKYLFVTLVVANKEMPSQFAYIRPHGAYWDDLKARVKHQNAVTTENHFPKVPIIDFPGKRESSNHTIYGTPVYGVHHMSRPKFGLSGGFCPNRGGDWGRYPWRNSGSGFPSNYEEITPMCDGIILDLKFWGNLWSETWDDPNLLLGNSGFDGKYVVEYTGDSNVYGQYTDPFLNDKVNPYMMELTWDGKNVPHDAENKQAGTLNLKMNFTRQSQLIKFNTMDIKPVDLPQEDPETVVEPKNNNNGMFLHYKHEGDQKCL